MLLPLFESIDVKPTTPQVHHFMPHTSFCPKLVSTRTDCVLPVLLVPVISHKVFLQSQSQYNCLVLEAVATKIEQEHNYTIKVTVHFERCFQFITHI